MPAPLRALLTLLTVSLLALAGLALPAVADEGVPVTPDEGGTVVSWGGGAPAAPAALAGKTVTAVAGGGNFSVALTSEGRVVSWARYNVAQPPADLAQHVVTSIDAGRGFALALTDEGTVAAWGDNTYGQTSVPASLNGRRVVDVAAGFYHGLALTEDGKVTYWGYNNGAMPAALANETVTAVYAGAYNSFAITDDGDVYGWGYNYYGQATPPASLAGKTVTSIAAGTYQTLALTSDGKVTVWGGDPGTGEGVAPTDLADHTIIEVGASFGASYALTSDGDVIAWGNNSSGQTTVPAALAGRTTAVAGAEGYALAVVRTVQPTGRPTVTGSPVVGGTLSAAVPGWNATPDSVTYEWRAGGVVVGTDSTTYAVGPEAAGKQVTVTVTGSRTGYASGSSTSVPSATVANATFLSGPDATISGTPQVGHTLTVDEGSPSPAAESYGYRWYADGTLVSTGSRTLTLTEDQHDQQVTVEVTARRAGHDPASDLSTPTQRVAAGDLATTGGVVVSGTPLVGQDLTATTTWSTTPAANLTHQWLRDGTPVSGATSATYALTNADAGAVLAHRVTATRQGWTTISETSTGVGPVGGGVISAHDPVVDGVPTVDAPLTATVEDADPADAEVSWEWKRGAVVVATGPGYTPMPADAGHDLTVTATWSKAHHDTVSRSTTTEEVAEARFTTAPEATVTGVLRVGQELVAGTAAVVPTPGSLTYAWYADGEAVEGADEATFTLTPAQKGSRITVRVSALRQGYLTASDLSDESAGVAAGLLDVTGTVTLEGTPKVRRTVTATSTVAATPSAATTGQWLRDGEPVAGATGATYTLGNADAGASITHQVTASRDGYDSVPVTSAPLGPVDGGVITPATPVVTGTPTVDVPLTATVTGHQPSDAAVALVWRRGGAVVGSGSSFTPGPADVDQPLTVTATFSRDHYDDSVASTTTAAVARAAFASGPQAAITGVARVGEVLTASEGVSSPTAGSHAYRWLADGTEVPGADQQTFELGEAEKGHRISVEVTALRDGYVPASHTSQPTGVVATDRAPQLELRAAADQVRRGGSTVLHWSSVDAVSLVARRGWSGERGPEGRLRVAPTRIGTTTYVLRARNEIGTTTAQVAVTVRREATGLQVSAPDGLVLRGRRVALRAGGLDARERWTVRIGREQVATGRADRRGRVSRTVPLPSVGREGLVALRLTGSEADRTGTDTLRVVRGRELGLALGRREVRASDRQRVTVTGLAAGERLTVLYQGRRVSPRGATASSAGTWTGDFGVEVAWGTKTVRVVGQFASRSATSTFEVVRRCPDGVPRCA